MYRVCNDFTEVMEQIISVIRNSPFWRDQAKVAECTVPLYFLNECESRKKDEIQVNSKSKIPRELGSLFLIPFLYHPETRPTHVCLQIRQ